MATRDKYDYTQQTILWGTINYNDVPSYSATSVGTTGNAYLIRNFLKQFFPFLDLSVKKTAGGSVNVAIQNFTVKFNFTEGGIFKEFVLNSKSLEDVLEPLFEGQGFDGMTDSTYSIPLPPMYNDEGQDVSYGYGYLFVRNENVEGEYLVNLDNLMFVNKVSFDVPPNSNLNYKSNLFTIPKKTIDYIKSNGVIPTANIPQGIYPTPTTNQSDLVTLEKGEENPTFQRSLNIFEQNVLELLNRGFALTITELDKFSTRSTNGINDAVSSLQLDGYVDVVDPNKKRLKYEITQKGKNALEKGPAKVSLTTLEQSIIDFIAEVQNIMSVGMTDVINKFLSYEESVVIDKIDNLVDKSILTRAESFNGDIVYYVPEGNLTLVTPKKSLTSLKEFILDFLEKKKDAKGASKSLIEETVSEYNINNYSQNDITTALKELVDEGLLGTSNVYGIEVYEILPKGKNRKTSVQDSSDSLKDPKQIIFDSENKGTLNAGQIAASDFISQNISILTDMSKDDPELFDGLSAGIRLILSLTKDETGQLEPFKPLENLQQLEGQLNEEDFDLSEVDLEELDLTGLEDDLELNDDELGDFDLTEFNELADFVESELMPSASQDDRDYALKLLPSQFNVLKVLYDYYKKFPVANEMYSDWIMRVLEKDNIIYSQNQILKYLEQLSDFEFVLQNNDFRGNISWIITPDGVDYVENKTKINKGQSQVAITTSPTDIMLKKRQEKAQKTGDGLDYDYYLIANILNNDTGLVTAGTVTTILQQQFKKNPKWDETEILLKLRVLTSLGMALLDIQNSVEYFEISEFGEDVVQYLLEQENKGLYPKSKPTQQKVALRPSPTESATLNPIGTIKQGNDGNNWQVRENKSGVKRWVKL